MPMSLLVPSNIIIKFYTSKINSRFNYCIFDNFPIFTEVLLKYSF